MKKVLNRLSAGQILYGEVVEELNSQDLIVNFNGDLVRVKNQSGSQFSKGEKVRLAVTSIDPISFQLAHRRMV